MNSGAGCDDGRLIQLHSVVLLFQIGWLRRRRRVGLPKGGVRVGRYLFLPVLALVGDHLGHLVQLLVVELDLHLFLEPPLFEER